MLCSGVIIFVHRASGGTQERLVHLLRRVQEGYSRRTHALSSTAADAPLAGPGFARPLLDPDRGGVEPESLAQPVGQESLGREMERFTSGEDDEHGRIRARLREVADVEPARL